MNINKIFYNEKNIERIYILVILIVFCMSILTACSTNSLHKDSFCCKINKIDDIKYLQDFNQDLSLLKIPKNFNLTLPKTKNDYDIPIVDLKKNYNDDKNQVNICPPDIVKDILGSSCVIIDTTTN